MLGLGWFRVSSLLRIKVLGKKLGGFWKKVRREGNRPIELGMVENFVKGSWVGEANLMPSIVNSNLQLALLIWLPSQSQRQ